VVTGYGTVAGPRELQGVAIAEMQRVTGEVYMYMTYLRCEFYLYERETEDSQPSTKLSNLKIKRSGCPKMVALHVFRP